MDETPTDGFRGRPVWWLVVAALTVAQAGLALTPFGPRPWAALADDRPVTAGRHPLHLYHGTLGSQTFHRSGSTTCFDPAFQAGYPKTPVFDAGCRPAEFALVLAGGGYNPAAYKWGLFLGLVAVPLAFVLASRGVGLPAGASCLAGALGAALTWTRPARALLDEGDLDACAAGLAGLVFVGWLARYANAFGVGSWAVMALVAAAGWYAHPLVWLALVPVVILYYLVYAPRHGLAWHLGLLGLTAAGVGPNLWWLIDWGRYWWLRQATPGEGLLPAWGAVTGAGSGYGRLAHAVPGGPVAALLALAGLVLMARVGRRAGAWLLPAAAVATLLAARVGVGPGDGPDRVAPLAAGFLVVPAAFALWAAAGRAWAGGPATVAAVATLLVVGWADGANRPLARALGLTTGPLRLGLSPDQQAVVKALNDLTTPDARVLWDEPADGRPGWNWSALLPVLTGRAYLGGLDPHAGMEHGFCGQADGRLNGRPLGEWDDADLSEFCRHYNVGWVVARSPVAVDRWGRYPKARPAARLRDGANEVVLFALDRPRSFVLSGTGKWDEATARRVGLSDVAPDANGWVVLSLHYQHEMKVYPSYVQLEPKKDPFDPIPHVQLHLPGPVSRVTLVWEP